MNATSLPTGRRAAATVVTAFIVAIVVHVASVLVVHAANGLQAQLLLPISGYFLPSSTIVLVLVAAGAWVGAFGRWYLTLTVGVVAALLGAVLGTLTTVVIAGSPVSPALFAGIAGTLAGVNLPFLVAVIVTATTLGAAVWRSASTSPLLGRGGSARIALVRLPAANLADGQVTHITRKKIDIDKADEQWDAYVETLDANGWRIVEVDPATDLADSVFVEDTVVMLGRTAVLTSPGAESRRAEVAGVEKTVRELGLVVKEIELPGTLDGGDVLKVGTTLYVGRGGRTNADGIRQLRAIAQPAGFTVVPVPVSKVLHLKSAVTALPDGTVIGYAKNVDDASMFARFLPVPEESGSHVVILADDTVLMAASAPKSAELIRQLGYTVVTVDISEYEKLEGCVTCLSVRIR